MSNVQKNWLLVTKSHPVVARSAQDGDIIMTKALSSLPPTKKVYFDGPPCFEIIARVIQKGSDDRGHFLVFDQTIFHPQGGGQPADTGVLASSDNTILQVSDVREYDQLIRHYVMFDSIAMHSLMTLRVNIEKRKLCSRLHSGGHLIAYLLQDLWPSLQPGKGYHFPDAPSVEFTQASKEMLLLNVVERLNNDIARIVVDAELVHVTIESAVGCPVLRKVCFGNRPPVPCGGTHVSNLSELAGLTVTKAKITKDRLRISYCILVSE